MADLHPSTNPDQFKEIPGFPGYCIGSDQSVWGCRTNKSKITDVWNPIKVINSATGKRHAQVRKIDGGQKSIRIDLIYNQLFHPDATPFKDDVEYKECPEYPGYRFGDDMTAWTCLTPAGTSDDWRELQGYVQPNGKSRSLLLRNKEGKPTPVMAWRIHHELFGSPFDPNVTYKDVPDFPGYRAGTDGSVWTSMRNRFGPSDVWRKMRFGRVEFGYYEVGMTRDGYRHTRLVHDVILETFVGPRPDGMLCRHYPDRTPTNNHINNIQWGTPKENSADSLEHGTRSLGEGRPNAKLTDDAVREIRCMLAQGEVTQREISEIFGISNGIVSEINTGKRWTHVTDRDD